MGRKPAPRANYRVDGIAVHRILTAIEEDNDCDGEWKGKIVPLLRDAVALLLTSTKSPTPAPAPAIESKKRKVH